MLNPPNLCTGIERRNPNLQTLALTLTAVIGHFDS
jgi:hypothetical protein